VEQSACKSNCHVPPRSYSPGVFTDPTTGACLNSSDPASLSCAYGAGDACRPCPIGGLCPGGFRIRSRPGYWTAAETATGVLQCPFPDPTARCPGWDAAEGLTACGVGFRPGSYLCGSCADSYFAVGDGTCAPCPVELDPWSRYRGVLGLLVALLVCAVVIYACLYALVACTTTTSDGVSGGGGEGGTMGGQLRKAASKVVALIEW
jgi:hypothetical protein